MAALSRILGVTGGLLVFILACGPQVVNTRSVTGGPTGSTTSGDASGGKPLGFTEVKALMDKSCNGAGCHSKPGVVVTLDNIEDTKKGFDASMASVARGSMPKAGFPKWSQAEIDALNAWKAAGFPEKAPAAPAGGTAKLSFAKDIAPLVKASCLGAACHDSEVPSGIPLKLKADFVIYFDTAMESHIAGTMPKPGYPKWTDPQVKTLNDWKAAAFPE